MLRLACRVVRVASCVLRRACCGVRVAACMLRCVCLVVHIASVCTLRQNDNGLPEALRMSKTPTMVRCMASPLSLNDGIGVRAQGVLAVWGGSYTRADHQELRTLAILTCHLLASTEMERVARKQLDEQKQNLEFLSSQRDAVVRFTKQLGTSHVEQLYSVARSLVGPLHCSSCVLWVVGTEHGKLVQKLQTALPAGASRSSSRRPDEVTSTNGSVADAGASSSVGAGGGLGGVSRGNSGSSGPIVVETVEPSGMRNIELTMRGEGVLGHVLASGHPMRVDDAHLHSVYLPVRSTITDDGPLCTPQKRWQVYQARTPHGGR